MSKLVRIKPFNTRKGNLAQTFSYKGLLFKEEAGWHEVDDDVAEYLATATADGNPSSPLVFDVADDQQDAEDIEEKAKAAAVKATAAKPHRLNFTSPTNGAEKDLRRSAGGVRRGGAPPGSSGDLTQDEVNPRGARLDARKYPLTADGDEGDKGGIVDKTGSVTPEEDDDLAADEQLAKRQEALQSEAAKKANERSGATSPATSSVEVPGAPKTSKAGK